MGSITEFVKIATYKVAMDDPLTPGKNINYISDFFIFILLTGMPSLPRALGGLPDLEECERIWERLVNE